MRTRWDQIWEKNFSKSLSLYLSNFSSLTSQCHPKIKAKTKNLFWSVFHSVIEQKSSVFISLYFLSINSSSNSFARMLETKKKIAEMVVAELEDYFATERGL